VIEDFLDSSMNDVFWGTKLYSGGGASGKRPAGEPVVIKVLDLGVVKRRKGGQVVKEVRDYASRRQAFLDLIAEWRLGTELGRHANLIEHADRFLYFDPKQGKAFIILEALDKVTE
jgi:hypothetical protein